MIATGMHLRLTGRASKSHTLPPENQGLLCVGKRQKVRQRSDWRGTETCMRIESCGLFMQRVDEQGSDAGNLRRLKCSKYGIPQQIKAKPLALPFLIHCQSPQHHYRNRLRHVAAHVARGLGRGHRPSGQGVIADHPSFVGDDIRPRRSTGLVGQRPPLEPVIQGRLTGLEQSDIMLRSQKGRRSDHFSHPGVRPMRALKRSFSSGGLSRSFWNASNRSPEMGNST